jgi:hypothetical protein
MYKNIMLLLTALLSLGMSNAFAGLNFPIGSGAIDSTYTKVVNLPLGPIMAQQYTYDIICRMKDPTGIAYPAVVRMDISGQVIGGMPPNILYDGKISESHQAKLSDDQEHSFTVPGIIPSTLTQGATVTLSWVAGDDNITPISFNCFATPTIGRK